MPDVLITDNLQDIISSIGLIEKRFESITGVDDLFQVKPVCSYWIPSACGFKLSASF